MNPALRKPLPAHGIAPRRARAPAMLDEPFTMQAGTHVHEEVDAKMRPNMLMSLRLKNGAASGGEGPACGRLQQSAGPFCETISSIPTTLCDLTWQTEPEQCFRGASQNNVFGEPTNSRITNDQPTRALKHSQNYPLSNLAIVVALRPSTSAKIGSMRQTLTCVGQIWIKLCKWIMHRLNCEGCQPLRICSKE